MGLDSKTNNQQRKVQEDPTLWTEKFTSMMEQQLVVHTQERQSHQSNAVKQLQPQGVHRCVKSQQSHRTQAHKDPTILSAPLKVFKISSTKAQKAHREIYGLLTELTGQNNSIIGVTMRGEVTLDL